jgi:hypothetical protein
MLMLIFVYPIKLVTQLSVSYLSRGMLGTELPAMLWSDIAQLCIYFGLGLMALAVIIICFYENSLRHKEELVLTKYEVYYCKRMRLTWIVVALTAMLSCLAALLVNESTISVPGYVYLSLFVTIRLAGKYYERYNPLSQS